MPTRRSTSPARRSRSDTGRRPSFDAAEVKSIVNIDMSPDSIMARGLAGPLPPELVLPKAALDESGCSTLNSPFPVTELSIVAFAMASPLLLRYGPAALSSMQTAIATSEDDFGTIAGVAVAGFAAQLVDGALGMGYGLTSSTVLVAAGLPPRVASEVVHLAQLGTTLCSGLAHHRVGTVEWPTVWRMALPGVAGALVGASLLSSLPVAVAKSTASALLLLVGSYLFLRFLSPSASTANDAAKPNLRLLVPVAALGGFVDVVGGGGWGPVATSGLLAEGRLPPSRAIGCVSMSEFFVTVAAVAGFCAAAGGLPSAASLRLDLLLTLLLGGLLAAPIAPLVVTRLPARLLGVVVGGFICITNARVLLKAAGAAPAVLAAALSALSLVWIAATFRVATRAGAKVKVPS